MSDCTGFRGCGWVTLKGTSKNRRYSSDAAKLPSNEFRFVLVPIHGRSLRSRTRSVSRPIFRGALKPKVVGRNRADLREEARYICQLYGVAMSGINWKKLS